MPHHISRVPELVTEFPDSVTMLYSEVSGLATDLEDGGWRDVMGGCKVYADVDD